MGSGYDVMLEDNQILFSLQRTSFQFRRCQLGDAPAFGGTVVPIVRVVSYREYNKKLLLTCEIRYYRDRKVYICYTVCPTLQLEGDEAESRSPTSSVESSQP